ncbi:hypothetical protein BN1723_001789 [Verticillium longisporum]|uniref:Uncharacterized protein n=1 Tax=Verticillium longisporum TaxID=100787 RepID=A0A0G4KP45_VERLO|nr:hypothetical protein BN1723_001789 [Verticillium longisporum]
MPSSLLANHSLTVDSADTRPHELTGRRFANPLFLFLYDTSTPDSASSSCPSILGTEIDRRAGSTRSTPPCSAGAIPSNASFTYRKGKRFREWAGFGIVTDSKPSDDIVDILGFLTFEMVQTLTEGALKVKEQEDLVKAQSGGGGGVDGEGASKKRKAQQGLFDPPSEGKTPIEPRHVQEAFRRLQQRPKKIRAMLNGSRLPIHTTLNII